MALVLDIAIERACLLLNPDPVLVCVASVHDEEESVMRAAIDEQVVDHTSSRIAHDGVMRAARSEFGDIVGQEVVQEGFGLIARDENFPHVTDVEEPSVLTHGAVFFENARILNGHFPAREGDHAGAMRQVEVAQRGEAKLRHSSYASKDIEGGNGNTTQFSSVGRLG